MSAPFESKPIAILAALLALLAGCRDRDSVARSDGAAMAILSPSGVIETLHQLRTAGRTAELDNYLVPAERGYHAAVILAVDQVVAANAALQSVAAERFGGALASGLDLSEIGDSYNVFSLHVRTVREATDGDRATVVIQEGQHVPLVDIRMQRINGRWLVVPERPEPRLVERLQKLARMLVQMKDDVGQSIHSFGQLEDAFRYRVWPLLHEIGEDTK